MSAHYVHVDVNVDVILCNFDNLHESYTQLTCIDMHVLTCIVIGYIVTIWKVVFANKSRKLGSIWMKPGKWG